MRWRSVALAGAAVLMAVASGIGMAAAAPPLLRVCADPNNLPFSNRAGQGFENKIVALIANDLHEKVQYTWWAQRRGFVRHTLKKKLCDVWPGVASGYRLVLTTRPYYRSSYVFVSRTGEHLGLHSLQDPRLRHLLIGVQLVGNDATNTPPAHILAREGITQNVRGFMLYGDYARPHPPSAIVDAVAQKKVDVAIVWGPLAGYFAEREPVPLTVAPITPSAADAPWPISFDIAMGVRKGDTQLKQRLDRILEKEAARIDAILDSYHVPHAVMAEGRGSGRG